MSPAHTRRVSAGSAPVTVRAGRITIRISSHTGHAVRPELTDLTTPAVLRPVAADAWIVDLQAGSSGRLRLRPAPEDGAVFPSGSALKVMVEASQVQLNVYPDPDVSSLATPTLLSWCPVETSTPTTQPAPAGEDDPSAPGGQADARPSDRLLLWIVDVIAHDDPASNPGPDAQAPQPRQSLEALGAVAVQARDVARQIAGGPRVPPASQRAVQLVIDASTSMRALDGDRRLADVVAAVLGAAEVIGPRPPVVHLAEGPTVRQPAMPQADLSEWLVREYRPDAFGVSLEAVRQAMPRSSTRQLVVLLTDDAPPDPTSEWQAGTDPWQVIVLEPASPAGVIDVRDGPQNGVLRVPGASTDGLGLDDEQLSRVVRALMKEES